MGWFDIDNIQYSDDTLDLAYHFLQDFSSIYENGLGRKPSIAELEHLLRTSFRANLDERFIADFDEKKVDDVKFKIVKRKKKIKYGVGDMCAIPLSCGGYAFTRIIMYQPTCWYLSEIFAYYSKDKAYRPEIEQSGSLMYPMFLASPFYNAWQCEVIHHISNYEYPHLADLRFRMGDAGNYKIVSPEDKIMQRINDEEAKKYNAIVFRHYEDNRKIIETALKEKGLIPAL